MQKILFAINSKAAESSLMELLKPHDIISTGAVAYREAILPTLKEHPADILLYRESLKGGYDHFELMKEIRMEYPATRIVFLANAQPITSELLCKLVFLGIYDIINSDSPTVTNIVQFIVHPQNFSDAAKFFHEEYLDDIIPQQSPVAPNAEKKKGFFESIFGKRTTTAEEVSSESTLPEVKAPEVDFETMRTAMLEESRRTAQAEIPQLVKIQVDAETQILQADLSQKESEISSLKQDLQEKTSSESQLRRQLSDAATLRKALEEKLSQVQHDAEAAAQTYQTQLNSLQTTKPPSWYQEQTQKWLTEREAYQAKLDNQSKTIQSLNTELQAVVGEKQILSQNLAEKTKEIEALQLAVPRDIVDSMEETLDADFVVIPDDETEIRPSPTGDGNVIAFMGTKHGVGNTTVAMNTAIAMANCGFKTLYIEVNRQFPMVNEFFEFSNIVRGLDTALSALQRNNSKLAAQCIIKPHGIVTKKRALSKVYHRLSGPLHFLLYSNDFLIKCKDGTAPYFTEREFKDLIYFLVMQERYSYIILDIQPDDQPSINTFLCSAYHVNQLVLTMTQDPHSITTAGFMITALARSRNPSLIRNAEFVVNQFSPGNKMSISRISDFLHLPTNRLQKISLDSKGYMDSSFSAVPYILSKGKYSNEYVDLRMRLTM